MSSGDADDLCNQIRAVERHISGHARKWNHQSLGMGPGATDV